MTAPPDPVGDPLPAENPFSARRIRPGAVPFLFPPGENEEALVERLRAGGWRGQIVGPHGSGKSTLLAVLLPAVERAGKPTCLMTLHDGQRRLPLDLRRCDLATGTLVVVDGCEQLSTWSRLRLRQHCHRRRFGLLITTHRSLGLPTLYRTSVDRETAQRVILELLGGAESPIAPAETESLLARHQGNLREVLFELYDLYELRR